MEVLSGSLASMKRMKGVGGRRRGEPGARDSVWQLLVGSSWEKNHSRKTFSLLGPKVLSCSKVRDSGGDQIPKVMSGVGSLRRTSSTKGNTAR
jgi:hypothetical protein